MIVFNISIAIQEVLGVHPLFAGQLQLEDLKLFVGCRDEQAVALGRDSAGKVCGF